MADTMRALAKLTMSLRIVGTRLDGYHLIDAEMVTLDLADVMTIADGDALEVVGRFAAGVPLDETNLVRRALRAVERTAAVRVEKNIPAGGGLGGGSADAAAILRWAGCDDRVVAMGIGADVPFSLAGGRARVTGIGEVVDPLPFTDRVFTLVMPPFGVSTVAAYRAWDNLGGPTGIGPNDLQSAAEAVEPRLAVWRERITALAGRPPILAGSGSTWFLEGDHHDLSQALPDAFVAVTRTDRP
jgi:4-diphosphocytidyl-2-C-methyl-D-erythritol kinase